MCNFCNDIFKLNRELNLPEIESIVYEDEYIYVMPDIAPLMTGHMLIISKEHYNSFANAPAQVIDAVECFLRYYKRNIGYKEFTMFEHGAVIPNEGGTSIDHAHIHIMPFELNLYFELNEIFNIPQKKKLNSLSDFVREKSSYIYFKVGSEEEGFAYKVGKINSQFLREIVNKMAKVRDGGYNWKVEYKNIDSQLRFYKTLAWWKSLNYTFSN